MIAKHFKIWWKIVSDPKASLPEGKWSEGALTFLGINSLIFAFFATLIVFLNQYVPMGALLIEGIPGFKLLLILPVVLVLAAAFFMLTFLVASGCMLGVFLAVFGGIGLFLKDIKASFYSSVVILFGIIPLIMLILIKKGVFTFTHFMLVYYLVYIGAVCCLYRLLSGRFRLKVLIPIVILLIAGVFFGLKILPKLAPLIV